MKIRDVIKSRQEDEIPQPVYRALVYMVENFSEEMNLDELSEEAQTSKFNLCRSFNRRYGVPPMRWLWIFRVLLAAEFIKLAPDWSLTDIAFTCGFCSSAHFSRNFSAVMKRSPSSYRRRLLNKNYADSSRMSKKFAYDKIFQNNFEPVASAFQQMLSQRYMA